MRHGLSSTIQRFVTGPVLRLLPRSRSLRVAVIAIVAVHLLILLIALPIATSGSWDATLTADGETELGDFCPVDATVLNVQPEALSRLTSGSLVTRIAYPEGIPRFYNILEMDGASLRLSVNGSEQTVGSEGHAVDESDQLLIWFPLAQVIGLLPDVGTGVASIVVTGAANDCPFTAYSQVSYDFPPPEGDGSGGGDATETAPDGTPAEDVPVDGTAAEETPPAEGTPTLTTTPSVTETVAAPSATEAAQPTEGDPSAPPSETETETAPEPPATATATSDDPGVPTAEDEPTPAGAPQPTATAEPTVTSTEDADAPGPAPTEAAQPTEVEPTPTAEPTPTPVETSPEPTEGTEDQDARSS